MGHKKVLYFSAEWGLAKIEIPIYAGGLGVLAGDTIVEADRIGLPWVGLGLLYREGFFRQVINERGEQEEKPYNFDPSHYGLTEVKNDDGSPLLVEVPFPGRRVSLRVWELKLHKTPLYLLDANVSVNNDSDKRLTARLYTGDWNLHLSAEVLLGVGGAQVAKALDLKIDVWHLNDDHATFSIIERLRSEIESSGGKLGFEDACEKIRSSTVFTTHTPVKGAESAFAKVTVFPYLEAILGGELAEKVYNLGKFRSEQTNEELFSLSVLSMKLSNARNAVSLRHGQIAKKIWHQLWPDLKEGRVPIRTITNGVNHVLWTFPAFDSLYSKYLHPKWVDKVDDRLLWEKVENVPNEELWQAKIKAKETLINYLSKHRLWKTPPPTDALFIGFARRFAPYKQPNVLLSDPDHLRAILLREDRPVYLFVSGKANPVDSVGKALLKKAIEMDRDPSFGDKIIFIEDYNLTTAQYLTAGTDVWINTPLPPWEACGTSGMKAVYNCTLNVSTFDGWWYEAYEHGLGWVIGSQTLDKDTVLSERELGDALFYLLEQEIIPFFYNKNKGIPYNWISWQKQALRKLAFRFNSTRMIKEYTDKMYNE